MLFDEWQACPGVVGAIKRAVDSERRAGRFILTGSARFDTDPALWPGTGRLIRIAMAPMTVREQMGRPRRPFLSELVKPERASGGPDDPPDLRGHVELALRGGFPEPALELDGAARREWLASYVGQLLVHERAAGGSAPDPSRLGAYFAAYALNSAGVVMPKRQVADSGLLGAAIGADMALAMGNGEVLGRLIETFVINQLLAEAPFGPLRPLWHHLRERDGRREVDLVADLGARGIVGIEVKAHSAPNEITRGT